MQAEAVKRRRLARTIDMFDSIKDFLLSKGIARVLDVRATERTFAALRGALSAKIAAQKVLVKDLLNLSYADL